MASFDKRIDEYIAKSQPFAQPLLIKMRELVHKACPDVTETIKWGMPSFDYKGPLFGMAAFKQHCAGGFWKHKLINDPKGFLDAGKNNGGQAMGNLGCMKTLKDLPPDKAMLDFLKQAVKLNDEGIKIVKKKPAPKKELPVPKDLAALLNKNKKAKMIFDEFAPSHRREYIMWIEEAKTDETRSKRVATTVEWCAEGKSRNWKYERKK